MLQTLMTKIYFHIVICLLSLISFSIHAATPASISLNSGNEISYTVYPANGDKLVLWFYSEAGPQPSDITLAKNLAARGYETWLIELFSSYFLPVSLSSMDKIPAEDISELITRAASQTSKSVIPVATGRAAIPLLRASRHSQLNASAAPDFNGLILISPKFYFETPDPGLEGELMPIVTHSNSLIFIMQPDKSPWYWKLDKTIPALESGGSDVFFQIIPGVRDRFYFRPDADHYEKQQAEKLADYLVNATEALTKFPKKQRKPTSLINTQVKLASVKKEKKIQPHKASPKPPPLSLETYNNQHINLEELKGKVVLVNFWASWCPPCVHEMPSMQRLHDQFSSDSFTILGVNMAEDKPQIRVFLKTKVNVNFPILLDKDGNALKQWQVFAFPTSYIIDKKGQIRYSLFGSIEWDQPQPVSIIKKLIDEN